MTLYSFTIGLQTFQPATDGSEVYVCGDIRVWKGEGKRAKWRASVDGLHVAGTFLSPQEGAIRAQIMQQAEARRKFAHSWR